MSLLQTLHYEVQPGNRSSTPIIPSSANDPQLETSDSQQVSVNADSPPRTGQPVFERVPSHGTTQTRRLAVTTLLILANLVQMTVNFAGIAGGSSLIHAMGAKESYASWIAASYGLTQGTFVLMSGRLGDVFGHRKLLLIGGAWLCLCTFIGAFCDHFFAFVTMRALAGVGGALIMPNAVAMISATNPPGRVRNLSLGFFAASAPLGGYLGALFLGAFLEKTDWKWFFVFVACLGVVTFIPLWALAPYEPPVDRHGKIDWIGSALGTSSLILFNFVWNQAPSVGWSTPYEIALLPISLILFGSFLVWEKRFASEPIMPIDIFKAPSFLTLLLVILLNYMAVGTLIWYQILWLQEVWHWSPLHFAVGWTPFVICATVAASLAAWLIPRLAAQWILAIGTVTILISNVLMATVPLQQSYWAQIFPLGLGFASTIEVQIARRLDDRIMGYRAALYFGVAISAVALILDVCFVRLVKDEREGWEEEDLIAINEIELQGHAEATGAELPVAPVRS
ncbi:hypothetical protein BBP40_006864 [Aspergillus hancockii]|nr:hypothetical protein BBP40_006864 [Aspergillus hancockii]